MPLSCKVLGVVMLSKPPIYLKIYDTAYEMNSTLIRFQEYSESPKYRKKFFTLDEYMDYYVSQFGKFDYFEKVRGMNIPSWVFDEWRINFETGLRRKEERFITNVYGAMDSSLDNLYFIAVNKEDDEYLALLKHEFAHGCYYTNPKYKKEVYKYLKPKKEFDILRRNLAIDGGYHKVVIEDELHAFLLTGWRESWNNIANVRLKSLMEEAGATLDCIFSNHYGYCLSGLSENRVLKQLRVIK